MAERPSGSHPYPMQSQASAPGALPSSVQQQQQQQQQPQQQQPAQQQQPQQIILPVKDINAVNVCRVGQEMVHDIVSKAQEIFQHLSAKNLQVWCY